MKSLLSFAAVAALFAGGGAASAHVGATIAVAKVLTPAEPMVTHGDPIDTIDPTPWVFASADASYTITWNDGDTDPTGRFTWYYLDHQPTYQVGVNEVEQMLATKIDDPINNSGGYFASCLCDMDMGGITCPPDPRSSTGNCANQLVWNTSGIAPGTYWLVAINNDPPYHVYNSSNAPIRISHGGTPPPAAIIVRPDGLGSADRSYRLQWIAQGKAPLKFDLAYGLEETGSATTPMADIATGISGTMNADGTFGYDWDISALPNNKAFWVRLKVTDADGTTAFTDSHFGVTVFHSGTTTPPDMAMPPKDKGGCEIGASERGSTGATAALCMLAALGVLVYFARRAGTRG